MPRSGLPVGLLLLGALCVESAAAGVGQDQAAATTTQAVAAPAADSLNARELGALEAVLNYCAQNDPTDSAQVRARLKRLVAGAGKDAVAEARRSVAYQSAHDSEVDFLSRVDARNAHRVCAHAAAAQGK